MERAKEQSAIKKRTVQWAVLLASIMTLSLLSCVTSSLAPKATGLNSRLDTLVNEGLKENKYSGAVLLVVRNGGTLHQKAYGFAREYDCNATRLESPESMTVEHLFDIASMTKVFATTFGVMLLVDKGHIGLDDPVYKYIPSFAENDKRDITVRTLLTHRAGMAPWKPLYFHASDTGAAREYLVSLPLRYPVGREYHYSDLGFMTLGYIIESVSGMSLDTYLRKNIYSPLGLEDITFCPKKRGYEKIAATSQGNPFEYRMIADDDFGFRCDEEIEDFRGWRRYTLHGEVNDGNSYHAHGGVAGHAGLFATAGNLRILAQLLLDKGVFNGKMIIRSETIQTFLHPDEFGNGLGWSLNPGFLKAEGAPRGTFGHTGFTGCNVIVVPDRNTMIIFLINRQHHGPGTSGHYPDLNRLRRAIAGTVLELESD